MKAAEDGMNLQRSHLKKAANEELDEAVFTWAKQKSNFAGQLMKVSS